MLLEFKEEEDPFDSRLTMEFIQGFEEWES